MSTPKATQATFEHVCQDCGWTVRNRSDDLMRCPSPGNECTGFMLCAEISDEQLAREEREDWRDNHASDVKEGR